MEATKESNAEEKSDADPDATHVPDQQADPDATQVLDRPENADEMQVEDLDATQVIRGPAQPTFSQDMEFNIATPPNKVLVTRCTMDAIGQHGEALMVVSLAHRLFAPDIWEKLSVYKLVLGKKNVCCGNRTSHRCF